MIKLHAISYFIRFPSYLYSTHEMNESVNEPLESNETSSSRLLLNTKKIKGKVATTELFNSHLRFRYISFEHTQKGLSTHFLQMEIRLPCNRVNKTEHTYSCTWDHRYMYEREK